MAVEYSYIPVQTVAENGNLLFNDTALCCRKGAVIHRDGAGIFRIKGASNVCKSIYKITFNGNIAVATGGTVGEISVALAEDGEVIGNAVGVATPAAVGDFFNVAFSTFVVIPCGCCVTVAVQNTSEGTDVDVQNANIIIDRVA